MAAYLPFIRRHRRNASARSPCRNAFARSPCKPREPEGIVKVVAETRLGALRAARDLLDRGMVVVTITAKPVAARVEREHQRPAETVLSEGHRLVGVLASLSEQSGSSAERTAT
jgi:hypothetical protein